MEMAAELLKDSREYVQMTFSYVCHGFNFTR